MANKFDVLVLLLYFCGAECFLYRVMTQRVPYMSHLQAEDGDTPASLIDPALVEGKEDVILEFAEDAPKVAWRASVRSQARVKENKRSVEEYMALPSSEYSVLSADQIERLSATEFKCTLPGMNFFGTKITPVLFVDVTVYPEEARSVIAVKRAETVGSAVAERINGTFSISAINEVSSGVDDKGRKVLRSATNLEVDVMIPKSRIPLRVVRSGGNFIMQSSLNVIVPAFIRILAADFRRWTDGSDERTELEGANLSDLPSSL